MPPVGQEDRRQLVHDILNPHGKQMEQALVDKLVQHEATKNPLYLRLVLDELRVVGDFEGLGGQLDALLTARTVADLYVRVLQRLESAFPTHAALAGVAMADDDDGDDAGDDDGEAGGIGGGLGAGVRAAIAWRRQRDAGRNHVAAAAVKEHRRCGTGTGGEGQAGEERSGKDEKERRGSATQRMNKEGEGQDEMKEESGEKTRRIAMHGEGRRRKGEHRTSHWLMLRTGRWQYSAMASLPAKSGYGFPA